MLASARSLRPFVRVGLPVVVSAALVALAIVNIVLVKRWQGELEDGVLWRTDGTNAVALEVAADGAGDRAGLVARDVLLAIDGEEVVSREDVLEALHAAPPGRVLTYLVQRSSEEVPLQVALLPMPRAQSELYYSLALVGILGILVGASVRLRRPNDVSTLHFFWLTVAFFGVLAFTPSGRYDRIDYFFDWADLVARLLLPPLFLHFALGFPERPLAWLKSDAGRKLLPLVYLPAVMLGATRVAAFQGVRDASTSQLLERLEWLSLLYLTVCLVAGLFIMTRALTRLRSVTAKRQLRWIVWGSSTGALPFVLLYVIPFLFGHVPPFAGYTAVLLGSVPLAFASALVRYRLMDVEVIIKKALVGAAYLLLLAAIYGATLQFVSFVLGTDAEPSRFWALLATFVVVLLAPWIRQAIASALDRLYYRDRYDYRRALLSFARDLNSDLDLERLSKRLVERVRETLLVDRMALFLADPHGEPGRFVLVASEALERTADIAPGSALGLQLSEGHTVIVGDAAALRRLTAEESAAWRDVGLYCFVPCVSKDVAIAVLAAGRLPQQEPLSSEDLALLSAVASQAATALENARLYGQLQDKADEIERLRQFSDSVVESLTDGVVVADLEDRVLRWNRRMELLVGIARGRAVGRHLGGLFPRAFVETLNRSRGEHSAGDNLYRVPLGPHPADPKRSQLVNVAIAPFQTSDGTQAGWIIVVVDVTERATLEEQLQLSEKMAAIGLLAAGVAHEVNTPLTGISSFTQMLLERSDPSDPRTELLVKIERQTLRAAKIVSSLLNLARPSGGEMAAIDLNVVINDVLILLEHQFKQGSVQVRKNLSPLPVMVTGIEYKLQQVLLNLFLNARDAMPRGGWLSVDTRVGDVDAVIEVADTGVGIPPEDLARIYDPFFTTKEGGGTGLGLSVTYGIVQEHGGTLGCESEPGEGTRFRLVFPAADASSEAATR